jgi:hypothetical protein
MTAMAKFIPHRAYDLAWVIYEYEAGGLRDAAAMCEPTVALVLNRSSPISSRPLWSTRATNAVA